MASNPIAAALDNPVEAPVLAQVGDAPERKAADRPPFPPGCPVAPLGFSADTTGSQKCYYLDFNGQLVALEAGNRHGKLGMVALFGPASNWLEENFPQWSEPKYEGRGAARVLVKASEIVGFDQAEAARALVEECVRKGIFDPSGRMRGSGAHELSDGRGMALHCGDKVLISKMRADGTIGGWTWVDPGLIEGNVYYASAPRPRPWHEGVDADEKNAKGEYTAPARVLHKALVTWNFKRKLLDPRFMLGGIGASLIGGWLPWRANIWMTGGEGTGKSTLNGMHGLLHRLFGNGLYRTGQGTAASIRQTLKNSSVPVMLDELEANNPFIKQVIELARVSSSGDTVTRGGQDHVAHEFTLRSLFWFSSILVPKLSAQDQSRLAMIEVLPLKRGTPPIDLAAMNLPDMGRKLMRRMVDGLWRLPGTKAKFHRALAMAGHNSRACDQFGTLLACADVLMNDWSTADGLPDDEEVALWAGHCHPDNLAEVSDKVTDQEMCISHLLSSAAPKSRGGDESEAISTWIVQAIGKDEAKADFAAKRMSQLGLRVVNARWKPGKGGKRGEWGTVLYEKHLPAFLAVANSHQQLNGIFRGQVWEDGVWRQTLGRCENALMGVPHKMAGATYRCVLVPLYLVLDESELAGPSTRDGLCEWLAQEKPEAEA